jgi:hypothetical protein
VGITTRQKSLLPYLCPAMTIASFEKMFILALLVVITSVRKSRKFIPTDMAALPLEQGT